MADHFAELVAEAQAAPVDGWDFFWLDGRASEQRPPWRYAQAMGERMARSTLRKVIWIVPGFTVDRFREARHP